jgi:RimJ/RimL family protein N-acetyltransferase
MQQFTPPPSLTDGLVTIRPWRDDDADALVRRINDAEVALFLDQVPQPYSLAHAREYFALSADGWRTGASSSFAIVVREGEDPAGGIGIRWDELENGVAEVGYWVGSEARGRGVATAALRLIARWAFETASSLERLQLRAAAENPASNRVAEKAGFTREGVIRSHRFNARMGKRVDFVMWSLLREEL